jgi:lysophospholipase L1-like esterase
MRRLNPILKKLALLVIGSAFALCLGELLLRIYDPLPARLRGNHIELVTNTTIEIENEKFDKLDEHIRKSTNAIGFRGENPPAGFDRYLTIAAVGGSTTECYYLSDGKTWPERIGNLLKGTFTHVWINNAGFDGHTTFGHTVLLHEYLRDIKPKVALFLVGVNEVGLSKPNLYDDFFVNIVARSKAAPREPSLWQAIKSGKEVFPTLAAHSRLANAALTVNRSISAIRGGLSHSQMDLRYVGPVGLTADEMARELDEHHRLFLPLYTSRLNRMLDLTQDAGILPVLVTQPALGGYGRDPTTGVDLGVTGGFYWDRLELYNDVTRRVAAARQVAVVDLAREMPKDSRYYYDWFHFSNDGAILVAELVAAGLSPILAQHFPAFLN